MSELNIIEESEVNDINDINDVRAIDYYDAIDLGLEPESYDRDIPVGTHTLKLIFKVWGRYSSLKCYFQDVHTEQRYLVMFFTNPKNQYRYSARDNEIDFSEPNILGNIYELNVGRTRTGNPRIESAIITVSI